MADKNFEGVSWAATAVISILLGVGRSAIEDAYSLNQDTLVMMKWDNALIFLLMMAGVYCILYEVRTGFTAVFYMIIGFGVFPVFVVGISKEDLLFMLGHFVVFSAILTYLVVLKKDSTDIAIVV